MWLLTPLPHEVEGYNLEGTKKTGASKKRLAKVLAAVKRADPIAAPVKK